jgi:hypothetical protein
MDVDSIGERRGQAPTRNAHCNQAPKRYKRFVHSWEPWVRT